VITVLLAEDQGMVRGALSALLNLEDDIEVLGSCADGASAWTEAQRLRPDVIVSDIEMPDMTGLELAMRVQEHALPSKLVIVRPTGLSTARAGRWGRGIPPQGFAGGPASRRRA
jgi:two-component system response regulator DesR